MHRLLGVLVYSATSALALAGVAAAIADGPSVATTTGTLVDGAGVVIGNVQLNQDAAGVVTIVLDATRLPAGPHGLHLHATGTCEGPGFTTAGGHFNPAAKAHGLASAAGPHAGDLPQVDGTTVSQGYYRTTTTRVSLTAGATSIYDADGTALVVHASADDQVTDPTGNSGARIACAVLAGPNAALAPRTAPLPPNTGSGLVDQRASRAALIVALALTAALAATGVGVARRF